MNNHLGVMFPAPPPEEPPEAENGTETNGTDQPPSEPQPQPVVKKTARDMLDAEIDGDISFPDG